MGRWVNQKSACCLNIKTGVQIPSILTKAGHRSTYVTLTLWQMPSQAGPVLTANQ